MRVRGPTNLDKFASEGPTNKKPVDKLAVAWLSNAVPARWGVGAQEARAPSRSLESGGPATVFPWSLKVPA